MHRIAMSAAIAAVLMFGAAQFAKAEKSHSGKVVSVTEGKNGGEGKLVMTDENGKNEHSHAISASTKITRNDKTVRLDDLKKGDTIKVTTADDGKVTQVAATASTSGSTAGSRGKSSKSQEGKLPEEFEKLNLSSQQKDKIEGILRDYDSQLESAWDEFGERYQQAIGLEASMLAAMEEHLTDGQRKRVHEHRHKAAQGGDENGQQAGTANQDQNEKSANPAAANANSNQQGTQQGNPAEEEVVVIGISLTPQQRQAADKIHRSYFDQLQGIGQELGRLHARLVALETEKIVKVEDVLSKDQLAQLRKQGQESGTATSEKEGATKK